MGGSIVVRRDLHAAASPEHDVVQVAGYGMEGELREAGPAGREEGAPTAFDSMRQSSACCPARHRRLAGGSNKGKEGKGGGMTTGSHMSDQFFWSGREDQFFWSGREGWMERLLDLPAFGWLFIVLPSHLASHLARNFS